MSDKTILIIIACIIGIAIIIGVTIKLCLDHKYRVEGRTKRQETQNKCNKYEKKYSAWETADLQKLLLYGFPTDYYCDEDQRMQKNIIHEILHKRIAEKTI